MLTFNQANVADLKKLRLLISTCTIEICPLIYMNMGIYVIEGMLCDVLLRSAGRFHAQYCYGL